MHGARLCDRPPSVYAASSHLNRNMFKHTYRLRYKNRFHLTRSLSVGCREEPTWNPKLQGIVAASVAFIASVGWCHNPTKLEDSTTVLNWSGTHTVSVVDSCYFEPETVEDVEKIVQDCHERCQPIRPVGSALSPNGIAFQQKGMMSLANLDKILHVDEEKKTVTVQAGARVAQVVEALRGHNLTLPNLASIAEQQMGGFISVGAHGTGAAIGPVDDYVTSITLVTPAKGKITLTPDDGEIFYLARVGLGCLGVVVEVTMECIDAHNLVEHTFVLSREEAREQLDRLLAEHRHMRYMWIPYTDAVVVVTNDPEDAFENLPSVVQEFSPEQRLAPMQDLLVELTKETSNPVSPDSLQGMGFGELRDALLALDPLDVEHVRKCNEAEAELWKLSVGYQIKPSDKLLQFDCGGQQWVWEICFPTGTSSKNSHADLDFMEQLLGGIEEGRIPAHAPIEQRWTARSKSLMSPAYSSDPNALFSWVGIINYLPLADDTVQRGAITALFKGPYCDLMRKVGLPHNATSHWAKLERPNGIWKLIDLQLQLQSRFPVDLFNHARSLYDPNKILSNDLVDLVLYSKKAQSY